MTHKLKTALPKKFFLYFLLEDLAESVVEIKRSTEDGRSAQIEWDRYEAASSRIDRLSGEVPKTEFVAYSEDMAGLRKARRNLLDAHKGKKKTGVGDETGALDQLHAAARQLMDKLIA